MSGPSGRLLPLALVPVGGEGGAWVAALAVKLEEHLPVRVHTTDAIPLRGGWRNGAGRLDSGALLDALAEQRGPGSAEGWTLGVVHADLAAPKRDFVFGAAEVAGCCAVIGVARLATAARGRKFLRRVVSEAVHELCHVAGLPHCPDARCVMYPSADVADTDRKGPGLCGPCGAAFGNLLGSRTA